MNDLSWCARHRAWSLRGALGLCWITLACPVTWASCAPEGNDYLVGSGQSVPMLPPSQDGTRALADTTAIQDESRRVLSGIERIEDADTALSLAADGAALYGREAVKLDGYAYCGQAIELAEKGEFRESARAASKALYVALQTGNKDLVGKAYRDLAIAFSYAGQLERAEQFANLALKYPGIEPDQVVGPSNKILGDIRIRQSLYAEAIRHYELAQETSPSTFRPLVDVSLANALILSGDLARARGMLDLLTPPTDPIQLAQLQRTRGRLFLAEDKPAEALVVYQQLADASVTGDESFYRAWALDGISKSELALGRDAEAAQALDQAIDLFDKARSKFRSDDFKMGLFSDLQEVFERAIGMHSRLSQAERAFEISERSRARALLDSVSGRVEITNSDASALDVVRLKAILRSDEVVVVYHTLPDRLVAWVLTSGGVREAKFPVNLPRNDLVRLVDAYRDALIRRNPEVSRIGNQIGQLLLAPLGIEAGKRIIIVPHGPLHFLPFQALGLEGQYLIQRNPISIAPSISIAARLVSRAPVVQPKLLAVGNPQPYPTRSDGGIWPNLENAAAEAKEVAADFDQPILLIGESASKEAFGSQLASKQIVHLATHGAVDRLDPLNSHVLFAGEDEKTSYLTAKDVLGMNFRDVALVVLSACETGLGDVRKDDEVLGFTRSFLGSGAGALISTLWEVDDAATATLMTTFYRDLAKGIDVQKAMRAGQLAVLRNPTTAQPYFWAPFNLTGNWRLKVEN